MKCPKRNQCNKFWYKNCNGILPTKNKTHTCKSGIEWIIEHIKFDGINRDFHLEQKRKRLMKSKKKHKKPKLVSKKDIRRNPIPRKQHRIK